MSTRRLMLLRLSCGVPMVVGAWLHSLIGAYSGVIAVDLIGACIAVGLALRLTWDAR
jgi:hypothetical protein